MFGLAKCLCFAGDTKPTQHIHVHNYGDQTARYGDQTANYGVSTTCRLCQDYFNHISVF